MFSLSNILEEKMLFSLTRWHLTPVLKGLCLGQKTFSWARYRVPLQVSTPNFLLAIQPFFVVFPHEPIKTHEHSRPGSPEQHGLTCVLRAAWNEVASGTVGLRDDLLVETDEV